jgi:hypothetical protein
MKHYKIDGNNCQIILKNSYFTLDVYDKLFSGFVKSESDFEILWDVLISPHSHYLIWRK